MNILYLMNYAGSGGTENYVYVLAKHLTSENHNLHFIYNIEGLLCKQMQSLGVNCIHLKMSSPFDFLAAAKLAKYCRENNIGIIHAQHQRENYVAIFAKMLYPNIRVVFSCHFAMENNAIWKAMNFFVGKGDNAIIAVCNVVYKFLILNKLPKNKIVTIPNGVEVAEYKHNTLNCAVRKEFNISNDEFVFVSVSRFSEEKGMMFLLKAAAILIKELKFKLLLVGDGELLNDCINYANTNGLKETAIFAGYRTDAKLFLEASNVFVNSSKTEAHSFAILEAMSKALPIIATNVGGNIDIVNDENNCGILVPFNDEHSLKNAMLKLATDKKLWEKLSKNSLKAVQKNFNIKNTVAKTITVYEKGVD